MTLPQLILISGLALICLIAGILDARASRRERFIRRAIGRN